MHDPSKTLTRDAEEQAGSTEPEPTARKKKAYQKPQLSKYEQLHGIGIGSD